MRVTADGRLLPTLIRRRFPHAGLIPLIYAAVGAMACAGVSGLFQLAHAGALLPERMTGKPLPPAPTFNNILFGAGLPEVALASGLAGYWLWSMLWKTRLGPEPSASGALQNGMRLLPSALVLGPSLVFFTACIGIVGLYTRTAPADQPALVRPFFGLAAVPALGLSALGTGTIPIVLLLLGLLLGVVTAFAVGFYWTRFPEEPKYK